MSDNKNKKEVKTRILENILKKTSLDNIDDVIADHANSMIEPDVKFYSYMHEKMNEKGMKIGDVIYEADLDKRYGYKLLNMEKTTPQRDLILRICYAMKLNLEETQKALKLYGMSELYPKIKRDAIMMVMFNDRPGDINDFNIMLKKKNEKPLRTSGESD